VINVAENHVVVLRLNTHKPSEVKPLEQVKEQVTANLKSTKAKVAATAFGDSLKEKVEKNEAIDELLALKGLKWKDLDGINRTSAALPYQQLQYFFKMSKPSSGAPTIETLPANNEYVLLVLNSVEAGDISKAEVTAATQTQQRLNRFFGEANYSSMIEEQRSDAEVSRNLENIYR
jgi:peptidyl-prolyl cis-trans isomerase D